MSASGRTEGGRCPSGLSVRPAQTRRDDNVLADIVDVAQDIVVPELQDGPAVLFQALCPDGIGEFPRIGMLRTIHLNDELFRRTGKVGDIASDWKLPAKAEALSLCARSSFQSFSSASVMTLRIDLALARCVGGNGV